MSWYNNLKTNLQKQKDSIFSYKLYIVIALGLFFWIVLSVVPAFFLTAILVGLFYKLESKWITILALINLVLIPIMLVFNLEGVAEELAVFVYYLLIFTVVLELKNYFVGSKKKVEIKNYIYLKERPNGTEQKLLKKNKKGHSQWLKDTANWTKQLIAAFSSFVVRIRVSKLFVWYSVVGLINLIIPIFIFNLRGLPYFRDLTTLPYFFNLGQLRFDLEFVENSFFNGLVEVGFNPTFLSEFYFIFWFFLGGLVTFVFLKKIKESFYRTHKKEVFRVGSEIGLLLVSLVYIYNPFIFERFLMGQHYVLRGHFLFMIVLYYLIEFFKYFFNPHPISNKVHEEHIEYKESFSERLLALFNGHSGSTAYFDRFAKLGLSFILLAVVSTHHIVFAYYLVFISVIFYSISKFIHSKKYKPDWRVLLRSFIVLLMVIIPSLLVLVNRYSGVPQLDYISESSSSHTASDSKRDIIKSFSLRTIDGENLTIQGILGAGSWDSRSFVETVEIEMKLGFLSSVTAYYNPMIGFLFVLLFGIIIISLLYQSDKNFKPLLYPFLVMIPVSLVLTFGYSQGMEVINSLYHALPGSYVFREGGKFYSLFLALISLLVVVYGRYLKSTTKYLAFGTFGLYLLSSLLLFWHLGTSIRYLDIVDGNYSSVYDFVDRKCSSNKKVLYLPFDAYVNSSFSDVYMVNPTKHALNCNVLYPTKATLIDFENHNSTHTLRISELDKQVQKIVTDFVSTNNIDNAFNIFDAQMKSLEVNLLIVDEESYPMLREFNQKLSQKVAPEIVEGQVFVYTLDWV